TSGFGDDSILLPETMTMVRRASDNCRQWWRHWAAAVRCSAHEFHSRTPCKRPVQEANSRNRIRSRRNAQTCRRRATAKDSERLRAAQPSIPKTPRQSAPHFGRPYLAWSLYLIKVRVIMLSLLRRELIASRPPRRSTSAKGC